MEYNNRLNRALARLKNLPEFARHYMRNRSIGKMVPFVGTSSLDFQKMSCEEVIICLPNNKKVRNHIGQVHAAATVLLAETASGMIVGMNIPDDRLPLMKSLSAKYIKRSRGAQKAVASLNPEQIDLIRSTEKGEVNVPVRLTDETDEEVVIAEMIWAWVPAKRTT